ncbi:MAG: TetR/AcrR family transcriptional regulator [Natronospirillum sp.]
MPYNKSHKLASKYRILKSATKLFFLKGFEKVSITQIMQDARMTHGAFYAHFKSKEALYSESFLASLKTNRTARLVKAPLSVQHLAALVTNYAQLREMGRSTDPGPESVLFNEIGNANPSISSLFNTSYEHLKKMIETRITALEKIRKRPQSGADAIAEQARAILVILVGAITVARQIPSDDERHRILLAAQKQILALFEARTSTIT